MPDIETLRSLLARVEAAKGPDRELDAEILFDLFATPVGKHKEDGGPIGYIRIDDQPSWNLGLRFPGRSRAWFDAARKQIKGKTLLIERDQAFVLMNSMRVPEISASIEAVVTLVERVLPSGWTRIDVWNTDDVKQVTASVLPLPVPNTTSSGKAATPALALLSALLKALIAKEESHVEGE